MDNIVLKEKDLPVFSYSKVSAYKSCPKAYKYIYIDKLPRLDKPYFSFGSCAHLILELFFKEYLNGSKDLIEDVMKRSFMAALDKYKPKLTKEQIDEVFIIMQTYLNILVQQEKLPNIINIEKKIWVELDNKIIFNGFIDRVQLDYDGILHVADYKTTKDDRYLKDRTQLLLYAYFLYLEDKNLTRVRTSYIMLKHGMKTLVEEHNIDELVKAKDKLLETCDIINNDKLFRATPIIWRCRNCDYIDRCVEGRKLVFNKQTFGQIEW